MAADVTLYGLVDLGLNYQNQNNDGDDDVNSFQMKSGQNAGSRFGLKGSEDLGNGLKAGFVLENGFDADDGTFDSNGDDKMFGREAQVYVSGAFGTLSMGRVGALSSGVGSYHMGWYNPFSTGWSTAGSKSLFGLGSRGRMDNTVTYVTPSFAGFTVSAQYSFNTKGQEAEGNERNNNRYAGLGVKYVAGDFATSLVVDTVLNKNSASNSEDSLGVTWGASYDFGVAKVFGQAQYGKNDNNFGYALNSDDEGTKAKADTQYANDYFKLVSDEGLKGYSLALGLTAPVAGGTVYAVANYLDVETESKLTYEGAVAGDYAGDEYSFDVDKVEGKRWGIAAGYSYPFSKRTYVYGYAAYNEMKYEYEATVQKVSGDWKEKTTEVGLGLVHKF